MSPYLFTVGLALTAITLPAQTQWFTQPGTDINWNATTSNSGIADDDGRTQYLYVAPIPGGANISAVAWRRSAGTSDIAGYTVTAEVALGDTLTAPGGLSTTFATNASACTNYSVVLPQQAFNIAAQPANLSPYSGWITLPLNAPWPYAGPNLLIDVDTFGAAPGESLSLDRCLASSSGGVREYGSSCSSATIDIDEIVTTDNYLPGTTIRLELQNAPANTLAAAVAGFSAGFYNGIPLPLPLDSIGMTGCSLLTSVDAVVPQPTDALGEAIVNIPIPNNALLANGVVNFQWVHADPALTTPLQLATTNGYLLKVGPRSCPTVAYMFTFSPGSATGTAVQTNGPACRITTTP